MFSFTIIISWIRSSSLMVISLATKPTSSPVEKNQKSRLSKNVSSLWYCDSWKGLNIKDLKFNKPLETWRIGSFCDFRKLCQKDLLFFLPSNFPVQWDKQFKKNYSKKNSLKQHYQWIWWNKSVRSILLYLCCKLLMQTALICRLNIRKKTLSVLKHIFNHNNNNNEKKKLYLLMIHRQSWTCALETYKKGTDSFILPFTLDFSFPHLNSTCPSKLSSSFSHNIPQHVFSVKN